MNTTDKKGIVYPETLDFLGMKCTCQHCGYSWISRRSSRPPTCAAQCPRQWYWYILPEYAPIARVSVKKRKRKSK